ncbi:MAG: hypothetical protein SFU87_04520 [Chitinophagaceae bacterium]|nr:hypothetical protein [Chitinophagaceae bacterium]
MEETNFVLLWKEHYEKIEASLAINKRLLLGALEDKAKSSLSSLKRLKTTGIILSVPYLLFLGALLFWAVTHYSPALFYFTFSVAAIFIINIKALADYIKHLVWVNNIGYDGSITNIQQRLNKLQLSIISHARIMCLQFPFFTTFYLSNKWFPHMVGWGYIVFQVALTGSFTLLSYWLYKNHKMESLNKKWFRKMIAGSGGRSVAKAIEFYREIEEFKKS